LLRLLLDAHIPKAVASQIRRKNPGIEVQHLSQWLEGAFLEESDEVVLSQAADMEFTLVTYDLRTIPELLRAWSESGIDKGGVIFVDEGTIPQPNIGLLVQALGALWATEGRQDWRNRVVFLKRSR